MKKMDSKDNKDKIEVPDEDVEKYVPTKMMGDTSNIGSNQATLMHSPQSKLRLSQKFRNAVYNTLDNIKDNRMSIDSKSIK